MGDGALHAISFTDGRKAPMLDQGYERDDAAFRDALEQLRKYFDGELTTFDLRLAPRGTQFQQRVWDEVQRVPYGCTSTYGAVAEKLGAPRAVRAVGAANGRNPLPIVIPCHRIIGADGSLTGYGGGLHRKQWLLAREGIAIWPQ
jgi:methylated-DNA-[protein]-cysteine S-methyltransferase